VALIEKNAIGGVCLNEGCIPTKALLKSAKVYKTIKRSEEYGIKVDSSSIIADWQSMQLRKTKIVKRLTDGVKLLLQKNGVEVFQGYGEVLSPTTLKINQEIITAKAIIIATGASPIKPPIKGLDAAIDQGYVHFSQSLLSIEQIPKRLVIIGGGVIGIEFATLFNALGTEVVVLEKMDTILMQIDDEIRQSYLKILKQDGIKIIHNASVTEINQDMITYQIDGNNQTIQADKILLSVGMRPNTEAFKHLNLKMENHAIVVDATMKTSIDSIYAIGDVTGKTMLAHAASAAGIVAVLNLLGQKAEFDPSKVPSAIYGFPEIAMVGLTEKEARAKNIPYKISKFPLSANGRALTEGESMGLIKLLVDPTYGEILGTHIFAYNASELLGETMLAMNSEATVSEIADSIHLHPSVSETVMEAAMGAFMKPIHIL
jgi:dihydrolipoamide dehydrogenase